VGDSHNKRERGRSEGIFNNDNAILQYCDDVAKYNREKIKMVDVYIVNCKLLMMMLITLTTLPPKKDIVKTARSKKAENIN
jgi:hypothetical protein